MKFEFYFAITLTAYVSIAIYALPIAMSFAAYYKRKRNVQKKKKHKKHKKNKPDREKTFNIIFYLKG